MVVEIQLGNIQILIISLVCRWSVFKIWSYTYTYTPLRDCYHERNYYAQGIHFLYSALKIHLSCELMCVYACIFVCAYMFVYVFMQVCMLMCACAYVYLCVHVCHCMCAFACMCVCAVLIM